MSFKDRQLGQTKIYCGATALTMTTNAVTTGLASPFGQALGNIAGFKLSEWVSVNEVIRPIGINVAATTTFTVVAPIFALQKAPATLLGGNTYVTAATGGTVTGGPAPAGLLVAPGSCYYPIGHVSATAPYTFAAADAIGDVWRVLVSTGVTAGVANVHIHYVNILVAGITDGVATP